MKDQTQARTASPALAVPALGRLATKLPPHVWFCVSAVFHYLGPAFAVLLFARADVLGVAWLRIVSAALVIEAPADKASPSMTATRPSLGARDRTFLATDTEPPPVCDP